MSAVNGEVLEVDSSGVAVSKRVLSIGLQVQVV